MIFYSSVVGKTSTIRISVRISPRYEVGTVSRGTPAVFTVMRRDEGAHVNVTPRLSAWALIGTVLPSALTCNGSCHTPVACGSFTSSAGNCTHTLSVSALCMPGTNSACAISTWVMPGCVSSASYRNNGRPDKAGFNSVCTPRCITLPLITPNASMFSSTFPKAAALIAPDKNSPAIKYRDTVRCSHLPFMSGSFCISCGCDRVTYLAAGPVPFISCVPA